MLITFLWLGKSKYSSYEQLVDLYSTRNKHYTRHEIISIKEPKGKFTNPEDLKQKEAELLLSKINTADYVVLLDERGKQLSSIELSEFLQKRMNVSCPRLVLIIGGAYGVHTTVMERADFIWSLSKLTLTHDMARVLLIEQVYRAYTILKGEKYHNE